MPWGQETKVHVVLATTYTALTNSHPRSCFVFFLFFFFVPSAHPVLRIASSHGKQTNPKKEEPKTPEPKSQIPSFPAPAIGSLTSHLLFLGRKAREKLQVATARAPPYATQLANVQWPFVVLTQQMAPRGEPFCTFHSSKAPPPLVRLVLCAARDFEFVDGQQRRV